MLNLVATAPAEAATAWMVQLRAELTAAGRRPAGGDDVDPMIELMMRTGGCTARRPCRSITPERAAARP